MTCCGAPDELIAEKVIAPSAEGTAEAGTDWRNVAVLLLRFPD